MHKSLRGERNLILGRYNFQILIKLVELIDILEVFKIVELYNRNKFK